MNIFFDHQIFSLQNYGGISRYFCELITGINKTNYHSAHHSLLFSNNVHLHDYKIPVIPYPLPKGSRLLQKSNQFFNYIDCKINQYDIYHATYFDDFLLNYTGSKPFVNTFYDMIFERLSHQFSSLRDDKLIIARKKRIAERATHLIAISENTKQDMIELLDVPAEKITVIYLGSSFPVININLVKTTPPERPYLLYVGNRIGYKNFIPFLKSVSHILIRYQVDLICAGGGDFTAAEQDVIHRLHLEKLVVQRKINDVALQELYRDAIAFIFPSLYEGFGIPILEAFSCNCPCLLSRSSSLPEIAGNAAMYMNPRCADSMAVATENIILNNSLRADLIERGHQRLALFSWERTVKETLNLYSKLSTL